MTFSLVARDEATGGFGMVVCSSSPAVAARCVHLRAGVGGVGSQNITDPRLGPQLLELLAAGRGATAALREVAAATEHIEYRQLTVVDDAGATAAYSGDRTLGRHAVAHGSSAVAAGNLLHAEEVPKAMLAGYQASAGNTLEARLLDGLRAGLEAGGEAGPVHSAGLVVIGDLPWPATDLRVDWSDDPIGELARLWRVWAPQRDDYLRRAVDPASAPSYGVPGDA